MPATISKATHVGDVDAQQTSTLWQDVHTVSLEFQNLRPLMDVTTSMPNEITVVTTLFPSIRRQCFYAE